MDSGWIGNPGSMARSGAGPRPEGSRTGFRRDSTTTSSEAHEHASGAPAVARERPGPSGSTCIIAGGAIFRSWLRRPGRWERLASSGRSAGPGIRFMPGADAEALGRNRRYYRTAVVGRNTASRNSWIGSVDTYEIIGSWSSSRRRGSCWQSVPRTRASPPCFPSRIRRTSSTVA